MTKLVALLGDPVAHSRSPAMQNAAFAALGVDARYELWHTPAADLPARVAALRGNEVLGANVTLPHKSEVIALLDALEPEAARIGAVNTVYKRADGALVGANTDAPAFIAALRHEAGYEARGRPAVVLGASGAARAATFALLDAGASQLTLVNRTLARAELLLADALEHYDDAPPLLALAPDDLALVAALADAALIVNATSIGWHGDETPLDAALIPPGALVYDMVYRPTRLLREVEVRGGRALGGLGMLVRQGALAFERWTGRRAPLDVMEAALKAKA
jgi:shikimate dehydrogenase